MNPGPNRIVEGGVRARVPCLLAPGRRTEFPKPVGNSSKMIVYACKVHLG